MSDPATGLKTGDRVIKRYSRGAIPATLSMFGVIICLFIVAVRPWRKSPAAQHDLSKVEIKTTHVAGRIYMLEGAGGNVGVSVGPDGVLIVDDQFAPLADKIRSAIEKLGEGKLKYVLNTHWHGDHTGGNELFGLEATIVAHDNVRKRLSGALKPVGRTPAPPAPKEALPVITFEQSVSIHFNGEEIRMIHYPQGHTDNDSVIFFTGSKVVHMGDLFGKRSFPLIDFGGGGDVGGLTRNIEHVISKIPADAVIIPGHGPLARTDDLKTFHQMLVETTAIVDERMKAGESFEQIKAQGLPDKWKSWGEGNISTQAWVQSIYKTLSRQNQP